MLDLEAGVRRGQETMNGLHERRTVHRLEWVGVGEGLRECGSAGLRAASREVTRIQQPTTTHDVKANDTPARLGAPASGLTMHAS